jgi:DTW domain-containing protein YfiP
MLAVMVRGCWSEHCLPIPQVLKLLVGLPACCCAGAQCITNVQLHQLRTQLCMQCSQQQHLQEQQQQPCACRQHSCSQVTQHVQQPQQQLQHQFEPSNGARAAGAGLAYVLVVVDGTWQQAKEMFNVMQPWLLGQGGCAVQAQLPLTHAHVSIAAAAGGTAAQHGSSSEQKPTALPEQRRPRIASMPADVAADVAAAGVASLSLQPDPTCRLRTEPHEGCTTTYEAIAQAVAHLEAQHWQQQQQQHCDAGQGLQEQQQQQQQQAALLASLLRPLQLMTQLQASFDPAVKARSQQGGSCVAPTRTRLGLGGALLL